MTIARAPRARDPDLRDMPAYSYVEAGKALRIPSTTIAAWVRGQEYKLKEGVGYFKPLIRRPDLKDSRLSFTNLIEAHVLRSLRTSHSVQMSNVRGALYVAEQEYGIDRLLIHRGLHSAAGELFLREYEKLVHLTRSEQLIFRQMFEMYLRHVDYDESGLPTEFYPLTYGPTTASPKIIALTPYISFGRPVVRSRGISTSAIRSRIDAGETREHVAEDYGLSGEDVDEALRYEIAA